jgi:hypothetical protein
MWRSFFFEQLDFFVKELFCYSGINIFTAKDIFKIMKKIFTVALFFIGSWTANAQLSLTPNQTATQLANQIVATSGTLGVVVSNAVLTCDTNSNGLLTGTSNIGINNGIVLGTGEIMTSGVSPNLTYGLDGHPGDFASHSVNMPGDTVLGNIVTVNTYDACILEFDLVPVGNFIEFEYVFGSEEYPEFNCSSFNDVFAFHISGPGYPSPMNIALIPTTTIPVSINSINDGTNNCSIYQNYYVNNIDTTNTMDGFTTPLIAHANVTSNQTYHLRMAIADAGDMILNSYVILKANSLKSGNTTPSSINISTLLNGLSIYPTQVDQTMHIDNKSGKAWNVEILSIQGKLVYRTEISTLSEKSVLNLGSLSKGLYILKMNEKGTSTITTQKFVKE